MQLIALNTHFVSGTPGMKTAVEQGFSDSLLGSAAIASAPHPQRNSVLIDAGFLLTDIPAIHPLERAFACLMRSTATTRFSRSTRQRRDHHGERARAFRHLAPAPPPLVPSPVPVPPAAVHHARCTQHVRGLRVQLDPLPDEPMPARKTDPRLGHFFDVVTDLGTDLKVNPRAHFVNRWRLEKRDPKAALSEPRTPIVYWLDKNIPPQYRKSVEAGVLEWNKAFEKIGFKNAIVARQQTEDAEWDNMDARHASIRWFVGADVGFAIGPSHSDPRTGEIIDADIGMSDVFGRGSRRFIVEDVGTTAHSFLAPLHGAAACMARIAATPTRPHRDGLAIDILEARGDSHPTARGRSLCAVGHQGRGHARGGPHPGPQAQLQGLDGDTAGQAAR